MENQIEYYHFAIEKLLPVIQKRSKLSCITFAIALIAVQQLYSFFRVPKNLRQFPRVSYFSMAKSFLTRESPTDRFKRIILPVVNKGNGFYVSKVPFVWTVYVTNPVVAKQLLLKSDIFPKNHAVFHQIGENSPFSQFLGIDNVAISNGDVWKKQRKVMNPAFHRSLPIKTMVSVLNTLVSVIDKSDGPVPITSAMQNFTLDVLGLAIFGFEFKALQGDPDNWTRTYKTVIDSLFDPVINVFATFDTLLTWVYPKRRECAVAIKKMNLKFDELARQKRAEVKSGAYANVPDHEKDLLTLMLEAMEKGEALTSDDELRHNIAVFFLAGHGTTAHTLSFCFYHLAKNKHVQRKLREEIISVLGDEPVDIVPSLEQMKNMKYMNLVIKENLRMNTPADTLFTRDTVKDISLAGQFIPKDTAISIDINAIHHDPKYWHNPEHFIPERFGEGGEQESHEGLTWLPFSNGSRQCIGMNFSLAEQRLVLAMLVRKYEIDIPKDSIHYERLIFDRPGNIAPLSLGLTFTKRY